MTDLVETTGAELIISSTGNDSQFNARYIPDVHPQQVSPERGEADNGESRLWKCSY